MVRVMRNGQACLLHQQPEDKYHSSEPSLEALLLELINQVEEKKGQTKTTKAEFDENAKTIKAMINKFQK